MPNLATILAALPLAFAVSSVETAAEDHPRALSLVIVEDAETVELEVVGHSQVTQAIEFSVELVGASTARHHSSTNLAAGERQVLSRFRTSAAEGWCATVEVKEASGPQYTLSAGTCAGA